MKEKSWALFLRRPAFRDQADCRRVERVLQALREFGTLQAWLDWLKYFEDHAAGFAQEAFALPAQASVEGDGDAGNFEFVVHEDHARPDVGGCIGKLAGAFWEDDDLLAAVDAFLGVDEHFLHGLRAPGAVDRDADA